MKKPLLMIIAGGSGSGKSTIVRLIQKACSDDSILTLSQDHYYKDLSHLSKEQREVYNFDHPDSLDSDRLYQDLQALMQGKSIQRPSYDFTSHTRSKQTVDTDSKPTIILDGIFALAYEQVRTLAQLKIFLEVGPDLRFIRRLQRDIKERGRSVESVIQQYSSTVRPMHIQHIEPTKRFADLVVFWEEYNFHAVDKIGALIKQYHRT